MCSQQASSTCSVYKNWTIGHYVADWHSMGTWQPMACRTASDAQRHAYAGAWYGSVLQDRVCFVVIGADITQWWSQKLKLKSLFLRLLGCSDSVTSTWGGGIHPVVEWLKVSIPTIPEIPIAESKRDRFAILSCRAGYTFSSWFAWHDTNQSLKRAVRPSTFFQASSTAL